MEDALRGRIDKPQEMIGIKSQYRRVHGRNDATQQSAGLKLTQTLTLQQVSEFVNLQGKLSKRIKLAPATRTKGIIRLAQRGDYVGQGLQGADDLIHEHGRRNQREERDPAQKRGHHRP